MPAPEPAISVVIPARNEQDYIVRALESVVAQSLPAGIQVVVAANGASPRRLHSLPFRLGVVATLGRWALAHGGIGRRWRY